MPLGPWAGQEQGSQPPRHRGCWRINTFLSRNERVRFGIIDSVYKRHSSAWKRQRVTMQFQYKACFDCSFFSGISFYLLQKQANFHKWKSQSEVFLWWATMLTVSVKDAGNLVCIFVRNRVYLCYFFLVTKAKLPPPRKMHECTWEVCTVCLLQCTTLCAVSWGIELGFELELVSRSNENFSLGSVFYSFLEACMYMVLYKVATYKQPKCCSLQKVGTEIAFLLFLRKLRDQSKDCLSHEAGFTWLEYWLLIICRERWIGCCWHRGQTCGMWPCVVGRSSLTPLNTRSTPWRVKIRVANLF